MKTKKYVKQIGGLMGVGMTSGMAGVMGSAMPGTTGAGLTAVSSGMGKMMSPLATVTGAGMVMDQMGNLTKYTKQRRKRR